jgi:hypothetical protein
MVCSRRSWLNVHAVARSGGSITIGLVMLLALSSCAVMFNGGTQTVPVTSLPERAEVFVDGASVGFTPVELELARNRAYEIEVRLGSQTRSFSLRSDVQGVMIGLDLVPVAFASGISLLGAGLNAAWGSGEPSSALPFIAVMGVSLVPIAVDFGTGAIYRLEPGEIVAVFE